KIVNRDRDVLFRSSHETPTCGLLRQDHAAQLGSCGGRESRVRNASSANVDLSDWIRDVRFERVRDDATTTNLDAGRRDALSERTTEEVHLAVRIAEDPGIGVEDRDPATATIDLDETSLRCAKERSLEKRLATNLEQR